MKRFINWLKSGSQKQPAANKTEGEHSDDSSLSRTEIDQADSSIFDTGSLTIEKSDAVSPAKNQSPDTTSSDNGVDPYNTGSFDTEKK
jgi:hypothetical protein